MAEKTTSPIRTEPSSNRPGSPSTSSSRPPPAGTWARSSRSTSSTTAPRSWSRSAWT